MSQVVRIRLPSMDLVNFIDNNTGKYCAQRDNRYYFKYVTQSIRQISFMDNCSKNIFH